MGADHGSKNYAYEHSRRSEKPLIGTEQAIRYTGGSGYVMLDKKEGGKCV